MQHTKTTRSEGVTADVDGVARLALSKLAKELCLSDVSQSRVADQLVKDLYEAASAIEREPLQTIVDKMLSAGISTYEIADSFIPKVAAQLGEAWCQDNINFATTTIGSARLQGVLRSLGPEWCAEDIYVDVSAPRFLVIVPEGAQHTLGATILTGQLRRVGFSVNLAIGMTASDVPVILAGDTLDAVLISASARESLEVIRCIVQNIHKTGCEIPVIVGGNVLSLDEDVAQLTGADLATSDLREAIEHCGLGKQRMLRVAAE